MTSEQLQKANELSQKITQNTEILNQLKAANAVIEGQKKSATLTKLTYHQKNEMAFEIAINPSWFFFDSNAVVFQAAVKTAKDAFIATLENDLQMMKDELNNL